MSYFHFEGHRLFYQEYGVGKPLLLLHGNTASSNMFMGIIERYAKYYKVIVLDFLGHGQSDRLDSLPIDLWYEEARQTIAFLNMYGKEKVSLIGTSGGALVAINVALEAPQLIDKVIADSFEGEQAMISYTSNLVEERKLSKQDPGSRQFYEWMHGEGWEQVVDQDTQASVMHSETIKHFFHKPLRELHNPILFTGSEQDEFACLFKEHFFADTYQNMIQKIGHGSIHIFDQGGHPAMLSNPESFFEISRQFLEDGSNIMR